MVSDKIKEEIKELFISGKTATEIAEMYGFTPAKVRNIIRRTDGAQRYSKAPFKVGDIFGDGNLEIVSLGVSQKEANGSNRQTYNVKCKLCGDISNVLRQNLVRNSRKCCKNCMKAGEKNRLWKGYNDLSLTCFHDIRNGAIARNLEFSVTMDQLWNLYEKQNKKCSLSGVNIHFDIETPFWKGRKPTASLDRIDSKRGYIVENIQWVHEDVNWMKQDFTQEEFINWCKKIHQYTINPIKISNIEAITIKNHHKNWRGCGNLSQYLYGSYERGAKRRNHIFNVSIQYLWELFVNQEGLCSLSGSTIYFPVCHNGTKTASLDRIDSQVGYIENNVQWVHKDVNFIKHKFSQHKMKEWCSLIAIRN